MNNPSDYCPPFEEMVAWLSAHKKASGRSWKQLEAESGIPEGTLSGMCTPRFAGNKAASAKRLFQFRQRVDSQAERARFALAAPSYVETPSGRSILARLEIAHEGRMTVVATGPGVGKTMAAEHYKAAIGATVHLVTLLPATTSMPAVVRAVFKALPLSIASPWTQQMSDRIIDYFKDRNDLLIVDEAGHACLEAIEQLRGWHDITGVGIALLGNEELQMRFQGNRKRHAYARLNSRIASSYLQDLPTRADVEALLDSMDIIEGDMRKPLIEVGMSPQHGGLREVHMILQTANTMAIGSERPLAGEHVHAAMRARATQTLRMAA